MATKPSTHRTPTTNAADNLRAADRNGDLDDPDATQVLDAIDPARAPLAMRDATPGEHGHIDGPRGLQGFHAHDGGDRPHGHRRDSSLGRTAALDEYVPPLAATVPPGADQTADPSPAAIPDDAVGATSEPGAEGAAPRGTAGGDAAGAGRPSALERRAERQGDVTAAFIMPLERLAQLERQAIENERKTRRDLEHAQKIIAELGVVALVAQLVSVAGEQLAGGHLVDADLIRQGKATVDRWAQGRGVR